MKTQPKRLAFIALLSAIIFHPPSLRAQGALTPPGAPGPTMKSLDQLEPRTIVNAVNTPGDAGDTFIISQPGSYYLTTNLTVTGAQNGITILANNVTLDLSGFAVLGTGQVGANTNFSGIYIPNTETNLTVRNGSVSGWAGSEANNGAGIYSVGLSSANLVFEHLSVSGCYNGIYLGGGAVRGCTVKSNVGYGIINFNGLIADCTAVYNGDGIQMDYGNISGCHALGNEFFGIVSSEGSVTDCTVDNNDEAGISCYLSTVTRCTANYNGWDGIEDNTGTVSDSLACYNDYDGIDLSNGTAAGCTADGNGDYGINAGASSVSGCTVVGNEISGIYGEQLTVSSCTATGNTNNGVELSSTASTASPGSVTDSVVQNNRSNGIYLYGSGGMITGNTCDYNNFALKAGSAGVTIYGSGSANNRIENNHIAGNGYAGINVGGSNNIVVKNSVSGNGANDYIITGTQIVGPIITATGVISSTSPWANFAF